MRIDEGRPSRVGIMDARGQEISAVVLTPGMSTRLYPGVFVPTIDGEIYDGPATQHAQLEDVQFQVEEGDALIRVGIEGCVLVSPSSTVLTQSAFVKLTAHSLHKGALEAIATIDIVSQPQVLPSPLIDGLFSDFSVSPLRQQGETVYGILTQLGQGTSNLKFRITDVRGTIIHPETTIASGQRGERVTVWTDKTRGNFFLGYGLFDGTVGKFKASHVTFSMLQLGLQANPLLGAASASAAQNIVKVYGGTYGAGQPLVFALHKDGTTNNHKFYIFSNIQGTSSGPVNDPKITSGTDQSLVVEISSTDKIEDLVRFKSGIFGDSYVMTTQRVGNVNMLRFILLNEDVGLVVEEIPDSQHDLPAAFAMDISQGLPKAIYIKGGALHFTKRVANTWVTLPATLGQADSTVVPKLIGNQEDRSLVAIWSLAGKLHVKVSFDGGETWPAVPLVFGQPIGLNQMKALSLPCGGSVLVSVENNKRDLYFRAINTTYGSAFELRLVSSGVDITDFYLFKDERGLRIFYQTLRGIHLVSIP